MENLSGRDMVNTHAIAKKVNEIIEILETIGAIDEEQSNKIMRD